MSLDKAIEKGREHRKPYHGAQAIDRTCRNHGGKGKRREHGQCQYCKGNRLYQSTKEMQRAEQEMEASGKASFECSAPDCLDCERNDECNHIGLFEEAEKMATHDYEQARKMLGVGDGSRSRRMSGAEFMDEVHELWGTNGNTVYMIVDGKRYFVKDVHSDEDNNIVLETSE